MKKFFTYFKNPKTFRILISILILIIISAGYLYFQKTRDRIFIDNSQVFAPIISIAPVTPGKLIDIKVTNGQKVKKGDAIATVGTETLHADTDGLIIMSNNQIGSIVTQQTPVIQMIQLPEMRIISTIDENKGLNEIKVGQAASFTIDALPDKTFWGYVDEISPSAKQTQLSFSISSERPTQQFQVYIRFNTDIYPDIKNGMSAKATIFTKTN